MGLLPFAFSIFPDSPFKKIVCLNSLLMQIKDLLRGITLDIFALKELAMDNINGIVHT